MATCLLVTTLLMIAAPLDRRSNLFNRFTIVSEAPGARAHGRTNASAIPTGVPGVSHFLFFLAQTLCCMAFLSINGATPSAVPHQFFDS